MAENVPGLKASLSVGFLEMTDDLLQRLPTFLSAYDAVVVSDGSFQYIRSVIDELLQVLYRSQPYIIFMNTMILCIITIIFVFIVDLLLVSFTYWLLHFHRYQLNQPASSIKEEVWKRKLVNILIFLVKFGWLHIGIAIGIAYRHSYRFLVISRYTVGIKRC